MQKRMKKEHGKKREEGEEGKQKKERQGAGMVEGRDDEGKHVWRK